MTDSPKQRGRRGDGRNKAGSGNLLYSPDPNLQVSKTNVETMEEVKIIKTNESSECSRKQ